MTDDPSRRPPRGDPADLLESLDPDLNIFALANGLDLRPHDGETPGRVLMWFSERMERHIHVLPAGPDTVDVDIVARGREGRRRTRFETGVTPTVLRAVLSRAVEAANALPPVRPGDG